MKLINALNNIVIDENNRCGCACGCGCVEANGEGDYYRAEFNSSKVAYYDKRDSFYGYGDWYGGQYDFCCDKRASGKVCFCISVGIDGTIKPNVFLANLPEWVKVKQNNETS